MILNFGQFESRDIRAWTLASNTGYTLQHVWGQPRFGLQADAASGGGASGPLKSFDPLFPKNAYFTEASINWPTNFIDVYPSVTHPADLQLRRNGWDGRSVALQHA